MLRKIVTPQQNIYPLYLPDDLVGKTVEVLAFEVEQSSSIPENLTPSQRLTAISKGLDKYRIDLSNYKFNRDEANDYE